MGWRCQYSIFVELVHTTEYVTSYSHADGDSSTNVYYYPGVRAQYKMVHTELAGFITIRDSSGRKYNLNNNEIMQVV